MAQAGDEVSNPATGERIVFVRTSEDTGGELLELDDFWPAAGGRGAAHVHPGMEERFEVVAGSAVFQVGDAERTLGPGESIVAAPGMPHVWRNAGQGGLHLRLQFRPALRWEEFVERLFALGGAPAREDLAALLREFPDEIAPAP